MPDFLPSSSIIFMNSNYQGFDQMEESYTRRKGRERIRRQRKRESYLVTCERHLLPSLE